MTSDLTMSPSWKRPTDVMKTRLKRRSRRSSTNDGQTCAPINSTVSSSSPCSPRHSPVLKRRNPFTCAQNRKRLNLGPHSNDSNIDSDFLLFKMLDGADSCTLTPPKSGAVETFPETEIEAVPVISSEESDEGEKWRMGLKQLPLDWSLKSKIRFLSTESFSWSGPLKNQDEARGVCLYVRDSPTLPNSSYGDQSELKSATMYWMHPNIPWLNLYPRQVQDNRLGKPSTVILDDHMTSQLHRDWCQSFSSLFNLLKANLCPYFYVLTHQFSALFRCAKIGRCLNALLTPTTRGLREAVSNDGISFTMPLLTKYSESSSGTTSSVNSQDDDIGNTNNGASLFLESIGVDKRKFPELNPDKVKLEREDYRRIDSRPESCILVQGEETKALFNYLLNCRSCYAQTGVARGIPPTLLAPVAFTGATLRSLAIKQSSVRQHQHGQSGDKSAEKMYSLELTGPILPDCVARLSSLMARTQGSFVTKLNTLEPTVVFNDVRDVSAAAYYPPDGDVCSADGDVCSADGEVCSADGDVCSTDGVVCSAVVSKNCQRTIRSVQFKTGVYVCSE